MDELISVKQNKHMERKQWTIG